MRYEIPRELTGTSTEPGRGQIKYMEIRNKYFAKLRYELYIIVRRLGHEQKRRLTPDEVQKEYDTLYASKSDKFQQEVYDLMMGTENSDPREVYIIMRKAYIVHSAIAFEIKSGHYYASGTETENTVERSFFSIQARVAKTQHLRYLE